MAQDVSRRCWGNPEALYEERVSPTLELTMYRVWRRLSGVSYLCLLNATKHEGSRFRATARDAWLYISRRTGVSEKEKMILSQYTAANISQTWYVRTFRLPQATRRNLRLGTRQRGTCRSAEDPDLQ